MSRKTHELRGVECLEGRDVPSTVTPSAPAPAPALTPAIALPACQAVLLSSGVVLKSGDPVTFTAVILPTEAGPNPITGTVSFKDDGTVLATITMTNSQATFTTSRLAAGAHTITAVYNGGNHAPAVSAARTLTVSGLSSYTTLSAAPTTATAGQGVTLTATVRPTVAGGATPTGTVTFRDGTLYLGTATLSGGGARLTVNNLVPGLHQITATYGGSRSALASTDTTPAALTVGRIPAKIHLILPTTAVYASRSLALTVTMSSWVPTTLVPQGTVIFKDGTTVLGTAQLVNGQATFTLGQGLSRGTHSITAAYVGSDQFSPHAETEALTVH